jgi:hypothetical protein
MSDPGTQRRNRPLRSVYSQLIHSFDKPGARPEVARRDAMPSFWLFLHLSLHVKAAMAASTNEIPPEVLLGVALVESRYDPMAVSRIEDDHRVLGHYGSDAPPKRWKKGTSLHCGPLQTYALTWDECLRVRDLDAAYATAAKQLSTWLRDRRVRGDITRALAGYGCGNHGVTTGKCNRYPGRVLWQARRIANSRPVPGRA